MRKRNTPIIPLIRQGPKIDLAEKGRGNSRPEKEAFLQRVLLFLIMREQGIKASS